MSALPQGHMPGGTDYEFVRRVMQSPGVRKHIADAADRKAHAAGQIALSEGVNVPVVRTNGTRPKGRPYARVALPAANEHGDSKTRRLRILGRVVGGR